MELHVGSQLGSGWIPGMIQYILLISLKAGCGTCRLFVSCGNQGLWEFCTRQFSHLLFFLELFFKLLGKTPRSWKIQVVKISDIILIMFESSNVVLSHVYIDSFMIMISTVLQATLIIANICWQILLRYRYRYFAVFIAQHHIWPERLCMWWMSGSVSDYDHQV